MRSHVYLPLLALGLAMASGWLGCQPAEVGTDPMAPGNRSLHHDYLIPAPSEIGTNSEAITVGDGPNSQQILYINFDGATITRASNNGGAASDNSAANKSWVPDLIAVGASVAYPAFNTTPYAPTYTDAQVKQRIVTAVTNWYTKYNVYVTTTRPATGRYTMMMVGYKASSFFSNAGSAVGVAPLDCGNSIQTNIGFAFAGSLTPETSSDASKQASMTMIAQTVAHEAGHTFGLEHVNSPNGSIDIMEPSVDPSVQGFLVAAQTLSNGQSSCGSGTTESTDGRLLTNLGPSPTGSTTGPKPTLTWLAPKNGTTVPRTFTVAVSAAPGMGSTATIDRVEIQQENQVLDAIKAPPYQTGLQVPASFPDGSMVQLTAVVYDTNGQTVSATTQFTIQTSATESPVGCVLPVDCASPLVCQSGACVAGTTSTADMGTADAKVCNPTCSGGQVCQADGTCTLASPSDGGVSGVEVGKTCTDSAQCGAGGVCAQAGNKHFCTRDCDSANLCPSNYSCTPIGADHVCTPSPSGCSYAGVGTGRPLLPLLLLVTLGLWAAQSRARRRLVAKQQRIVRRSKVALLFSLSDRACRPPCRPSRQGPTLLTRRLRRDAAFGCSVLTRAPRDSG